MAEMSVMKAGDGLVPVGDHAREVFSQLKTGEEILVDYVKGRSGANHRRFFSFVRLTFDWQEEYDDPEVWRGILLIMGGHFTTVLDRKGHTHLWPKSISWKEMDDEIKFRALFSSVVQGYITKYGRTLDDNQLTMVVNF